MKRESTYTVMFLLLVCILLLFNGCVSGQPEPEGTSPEEPTLAPSPRPGEPEEIVLRVSVIQYEGMTPADMGMPLQVQPAERLGLLIEGMERASKALSTEERLVRFEIVEIRDMVTADEQTCQPDMFSGTVDTSPTCLQALSIDDCFKAFWTSTQGLDIYMQESALALHTLESGELGPVNPSSLGWSMDLLVEPSRLAFEDRGVGQASSPLVLIYNPDILGDLPETISAGEVLERAWEHPLVLPPHKGIIAAMSQSLLGSEFDEMSPLRRSFYDTITETVGKEIDEVISTGQITSLDTVDLLNGFANQEIAWTIHNTMFLRTLAARGYPGSVATTRLPIIEEIGGTAMMIGWGVPAGSEHKELAWEFIGQLVHDPAVIEWSLSNGGLPVSEDGIEMLLESPEMAEGWLPSGLLERDDGLARLLESSAESRAWRLQPQVPVEIYNQQIVPVGIDILRRLFRGEISYKQGMDEWLGLLEENALLGD